MAKSDRMLAEIKKRMDEAETINVEEEKALVVIFRLHGDCYAFWGDDIKEILLPEEIVYVPGCPEFIDGIINVRGDIESVLNLHKLMGLEESSLTGATRIIIAEKDGIRSGIRVDSVEDVIEVPTETIKPPIPTLDKAIREFSLGGERFFADEYVSILDVGKMFKMIASEKSDLIHGSD